MKNKFFFTRFRAEDWQNIALVAMFVFYFTQSYFTLQEQDLFAYLGADYRAFYSAGQIARDYNYAKIYDVDLTLLYQKNLVPTQAAAGEFFLLPIAYPIFFMVPFQFLSMLKPEASFILWTVLNVVGLGGYLVVLSKKIGAGIPLRLLITIMLAYSTYQNFFFGQVGTWLVICTGEFLRSWRDDRYLHSGLWLSGLLIKPNILVLIIPILLLRRDYKILAGFAIGSILIASISVIIGEPSSIAGLVKIWIYFSEGLPTISPENMMNWRMVGLQFSNIISPTIGWGIAWGGMLATVLAVIYLWKNSKVATKDENILRWFGTFAATLAFTWHAHIHMGMVLIPFFIFLFLQFREIEKLAFIWGALPLFGYLIALFLAILIVFNLISIDNAHGGLLISFSVLCVNLFLLYWSMCHLLYGRHN